MGATYRPGPSSEVRVEKTAGTVRIVLRAPSRSTDEELRALAFRFLNAALGCAVRLASPPSQAARLIYFKALSSAVGGGAAGGA